MPGYDWDGLTAQARLINTGVLIDYSWHRYAKVWRVPVAGELLRATTSRLGFPSSSAARTPATGTRRRAITRATCPRRRSPQRCAILPARLVRG